MTAEIAIMNREAVALAADSAVTLSNVQGDPVKIYQSANKIFALSQHQPVGIMFYDSASVMGLPWETLVKVYRRHLGERSFPTLGDYAEDFFAFVSKNAALLPAAKYFVPETVGGFFNDIILDAVQRAVESATHGNAAGITATDLAAVFDRVIAFHHAKVSRGTRSDGLSNAADAALRRKHATEIESLINQIFEKSPLSVIARKQLREIGHHVLTRFFVDIQPGGKTGTVIAGFGDAEVLPAVGQYEIVGITPDGYMKRKSEPVLRVDDASIQPFAQIEMVRGFMEGIDPEYSTLIDSLLTQVIAELPEKVLDLVPNLAAADRTAVMKQLAANGAAMLQNTVQQLAEWRFQKFVDPVIQMVGGLPKDELASLAEALVNLTVLKRRVSTQAETVGGPIDVAVISKGDGFVWIKRKHYFRPELNLQFTQRYHRGPGSTSAGSSVNQRPGRDNGKGNRGKRASKKPAKGRGR